MTRVEQRKLISELRDYVHKMTRDDSEAFAMLLKRDKDDEDLDELSKRRLDELVKTYVKKKTRTDIEAAWKKLRNADSAGNSKP